MEVIAGIISLIVVGLGVAVWYYRSKLVQITTTPINETNRIQTAESLEDATLKQELTDATSHANVTNGATLLNELSNSSTGK